jgi:serine/threonine-protein kinase
VVADDTLQVITDDRTAVGAPPPPTPPRAAASPPAELPPDAPGRRRRWPWVLLALLVAALAGVGGAYAWVQANIPTHKMPQVVNLSEQEAVERLRALDFKVRTQHRYVDGTSVDQVLDQDPDEGVTRKEGSTVTLTVSDGPSPVDVPELAGLNQNEAETALKAKGLALGTITPTPNEDVPPGVVLDWTPKEAQLPKGTAVDVSVSGGPAKRTIENYAGRTLEEVQPALALLRLNAAPAEEFSNSVEAGRVIRTEPAAGASVDRDSTVTVFVSKGPDVVQVPSVNGLSVAAAVERMQQNGLTVTNVFGPPNRRVFTTLPAAGATVVRGSGVNLYTG